MLRRLAWALVAACAVCALLDTAIDAAVQPLLSRGSIAVHGWPLVNAAAFGSALLGALIVASYPRHPVGWLLSAVGITTSLSLLGEIYGIWVLDEGGSGPTWLGHAGGWVAAAFGGPSALAGLTMVFLLVPDGRLMSARWRVVFVGSAVSLVLFTAGLALVSPADMGGRADPDSYGGLSAVLVTVGVLLATLCLLLSVVSMVLRLRSSVGDTRQQLRWVIAGAAFVGAGLVILLTSQGLRGNTGDWISSLPLFVAYFCLPFTIAIAILRYRLYDIDLIINRAVILTLATLFAALGYIAIVVIVGSALGARAHGYWLSVLATAVVALAFQPARRAVVRLADRLAYGERALPYETLSHFTRRIGDPASQQDLLPLVAETAARALSAPAATARLFLVDGDDLSAHWPPTSAASPAAAAGAGAVVRAQVEDRDGALGGIEVMLDPGRHARRHEQDLVSDLAGHAAVAFRNARLEAELAKHVESLGQHNEALVASRRRLFEAGDAGRRRLERAIDRDVVSLLMSLRTSIATLSAADPGTWPADALGRSVDDATAALEALRELTRGIYPTMLTRSGLGPALVSFFGRRGSSGVLEIDSSVAERRFGARVEATAYLCCTEDAPDDESDGRVKVWLNQSRLQIAVRRRTSVAVDYQTLVDRVEALGGKAEVDHDEPYPGTTTLEARLPVESSA